MTLAKQKGIFAPRPPQNWLVGFFLSRFSLISVAFESTGGGWEPAREAMVFPPWDRSSAEKKKRKMREMKAKPPFLSRADNPNR